MNRQVAVGCTTHGYNSIPPFHPDRRFPEMPFDEISSQDNAPYRLLRDLLHDLGFDADHWNTPTWNPLGWLIQPGQTVLLKPNFVLSFNAGGDDLFAVVTHPSILRALIDYAYIALKGTGRIIIADAPQMDCNWDELLDRLSLSAIRDFYRNKFNFDIDLYDLRYFSVIDRRQPAYSQNRKTLPGDPLGTITINLGRDSLFYGLPSENYYGADFDRHETIRHHHDETHEYAISKTVLSADVFISVPKMKVHKKVGVTLNLKGLVGINTNKNCLIHYRVGAPRDGGDQLPPDLRQSDYILTKIQRWFFDHALAKQNRLGDWVYQKCLFLYRTFIKPFRRGAATAALRDGGNWYGNDSAWRMTADLTRILFFADVHGQLQTIPQRKIFCVIDGIIGGENDGPLCPTVKPAGCLVAGANPIIVDLVTARLMGFGVRKMKLFDFLLKNPWPSAIPSIADGWISYGQTRTTVTEFLQAKQVAPDFHFHPHPGWVGYVEA